MLVTILTLFDTVISNLDFTMNIISCKHFFSIAGEIESSKELLITSDSNNAFKRNYTRRPLPSRLSHYNRPQPSITNPDISKEDTTEHSFRKPVIKKSEEEKTTQRNVLENESIEDVNMGDLGFFDEFDKDKETQKEGQPQRMRQKFGGVPPPSPSALLQVTQTTRIDKNAKKLDRVIDGAALLRVTHFI